MALSRTCPLGETSYYFFLVTSNTILRNITVLYRRRKAITGLINQYVIKNQMLLKPVISSHFQSISFFLPEEYHESLNGY